AIRLIKPAYQKALGFVTRQFKTVLLISSLLCLSGIFAFFGMGSKFLPELREGHYIVHTTSIPGTSLQESIRIGSRITEAFLKIPGIESVSQWAGRAERGADTYGSHYSEFEVRLKPMSGREQQRILTALRKILGAFPGILYEANTFLTERVDETISGYTSPVVVNIFGNDLNAMDLKAEEVAAVMRTVPGAAEVQLRSPPATPVIQVNLREDKLNFWGLRSIEVMSVIQTAYQSKLIGKNIQGNRIFDISVTLTPEFRHRPDLLGRLPIRTLDGTLITLAQVADIRLTSGRYNILHQNAQRRQAITANVVDRDYDAFILDLKSRVFNTIRFPASMYPEFTGAAIEQSKARKDLILHSLLAGTGVMIFIYIALGSFRHTLITLVNLPFSLVGGIAAVLLSGESLSIGSVVGFVTLFGITVRNSIMLLSHYRYLTETEGKPWNLETVTQGAQERLPSILMTALVTALAMSPIAFDSDNPGREIMGPMAAIIIGGLASSTLLNLLLLPAILLRFGKFGGKDVIRK
ncbi:efflux RND transporter permease subunit, partial [Methylicorpusculum sp.]